MFELSKKYYGTDKGRARFTRRFKRKSYTPTIEKEKKADVRNQNSVSKNEKSVSKNETAHLKNEMASISNKLTDFSRTHKEGEQA